MEVAYSLYGTAGLPLAASAVVVAEEVEICLWTAQPRESLKVSWI